MTGEIQYFERLYQKTSQDPGVLEKNAIDHPYSSLAGLLLLYHYKKTNHPGFEKLAKKTALHFNNTNWLQFLLDQPLNGKSPEVILQPSHPEVAIINDTAIGFEETIQITLLPHSTKHVELVGNQALAEENIGIPPGEEVNSVVTGTEPVPEIAAVQIVTPGNIEPTAISTETTTPEEIAFEPLHTVDYFASQGIKITEEPETTDKLGNQMKSFTAWLKSMKKLHSSKLTEQDLATENQIQNSAEESNINTEILTEAMAEVLIKQDKRDKAIEMYHKLSLINPSKSAYFAAKIESIKSS
ncbi:MAG: hypothetical protein ABI416_18800 [Ginsengibacter sp.]